MGLINTHEAGERMSNLHSVMIRFSPVELWAESHTNQISVRVEIIIPVTQAQNLTKPMTINQEEEHLAYRGLCKLAILCG